VGGGCVDRGEYLGLAHLLAAQHGLDPGGLLCEVTAAGTGECIVNLFGPARRAEEIIQCVVEEG
jgi:hypothetical protein